MTKRGRKQKLKDGDEYDAITKFPLCVFENNTGLRKAIKRRLNKRDRRKTQEELRDLTKYE